MDILGRLRAVFWACVIGLWGLFMYQYIRKDLTPVGQMRLVQNPFNGAPPPVRTAARTARTARPAERPMVSPLAGGLDIRQIGSTEQRGSGAAPDTRPGAPGTGAAGEATEAEPPAQPPPQVQERPAPPAPPGFASEETRHFVVYEEGERVSREVLDQVENLHGNIMLDLAAFSPWTRDKKIFIFFTGSQDTYQRLTGRPAWSGGVASLSERKIYLFKSAEAFGILSHELTHIYFDSFFPAGRPSPLWLSEGLATLIQSERGYSTPNWLRRNMRVIEQGGGFRLDDLVRIEDMKDADEESVRLWYAQSYSLVRFLSRMRAGESFYIFCRNLRDGMPTHKALYQAYGMPYNKLSALEYAWRYDLKTKKISGTAR